MGLSHRIRCCNLLSLHLCLQGGPEREKMAVSLDPTKSGLDVQQSRSHPSLLLIAVSPLGKYREI